MKPKDKEIVWIAAFIAFMLATCALIDIYKPQWAYPNQTLNATEYLDFECYRHNYTERTMEPMSVYPIFYNQSGFAVVDGYGGGLIRIFTDCLESYAVRGNETVWCNETVEVCEEVYNNKI